MIDCYTWMTDNGYKPRMMLEETGLVHKIIPVNIREKAQMSPEFMKISPGHKISAIVDHDGHGGAIVTLCESGAILKYLAEKSGKFYPTDPIARVKVTSGCSTARRPSPRWLSSSATGLFAPRRRCRPRNSTTMQICATC
jgi:glutathione S-transferase